MPQCVIESEQGTFNDSGHTTNWGHTQMNRQSRGTDCCMTVCEKSEQGTFTDSGHTTNWGHTQMNHDSRGTDRCMTSV